MKPVTLAVCAFLGVAGAGPAALAYPIDCAILLCMAGGFPVSAECSAAKAEVIRRITPWPVEPPLQLWRCPMGIDPEVAAVAGIVLPQLGPDGLTPEVRAYRDGIEIYHIRHIRQHQRDAPEDTIIDRTSRGHYLADGGHAWRGASFMDGPEWLASVTGARRRPVYEYSGGESQQHRRLVGYENYWNGSLRGVALRYRDHTGAAHDEFVRY